MYLHKSNTMMLRVLAAVAVLSILASAASHADYCDRYKFGSPEWWECTTDERSPG